VTLLNYGTPLYLYICDMAEAINFKFGVQIDYKKYYRTGDIHTAMNIA